MEVAGYTIIALLAAYSAYVRVVSPENAIIFHVLFWGLLIGGVYLFSWWALIPYFGGLGIGGYLGRLRRYGDDDEEDGPSD